MTNQVDASKENRFQAVFSLNEECIYLNNETEDEIEVRIQFLGDSRKFSKNSKLQLVKTIADLLLKSEVEDVTGKVRNNG